MHAAVYMVWFHTLRCNIILHSLRDMLIGLYILHLRFIVAINISLTCSYNILAGDNEDDPGTLHKLVHYVIITFSHC